MKEIRSEVWTPDLLVDKIDKEEIIKPVFQRRRVWTVLPDEKGKIPNHKFYIDFLFKNGITLEAITFAEEIESSRRLYKNIDGNNRMIAIYNYMKNPFAIYPDDAVDLWNLIYQQLPSLDIHTMAQLHKEIVAFDYHTFSTFSNMRSLLKEKRSVNSLLSSITSDERDILEDWFLEIQKKVRLPNGQPFNTGMKINVHVLCGYSSRDQIEMFEQLNKYKANLSPTEIFAAVYCDKRNIEIRDRTLKLELEKHLQDYYSKKNEGEVLTCDATMSSMNPFEIMISLQNYYRKQYELLCLPQFDASKKSLFFKIYEREYGDSFDTESMNAFIELMKKTMDMFQEIVCNIIPRTLDKQVTHTDLAKFDLAENNIYVLLVIMIAAIQSNQIQTQQKVKKDLRLVILYHYLKRFIKDKDMKDKFGLHDILSFPGGGSFIVSFADRLANSLPTLSEKVTRPNMKALVLYILEKELTPKTKDSTKRKNRLSFIANYLLTCYYNKKMPNEYLNKRFDTDHIVPFSSQWEGEIDVNRLGNMTPIMSGMNQGRNNGHIDYYFKEEHLDYTRHIQMIPTVEEYNNMIEYKKKGRKDEPHIQSCELFNEFCAKNEKILVDNMLKHLFS